MHNTNAPLFPGYRRAGQVTFDLLQDDRGPGGIHGGQHAELRGQDVPREGHDSRAEKRGLRHGARDGGEPKHVHLISSSQQRFTRQGRRVHERRDGGRDLRGPEEEREADEDPLRPEQADQARPSSP